MGLQKICNRNDSLSLFSPLERDSLFSLSFSIAQNETCLAASNRKRDTAGNDHQSEKNAEIWKNTWDRETDQGESSSGAACIADIWWVRDLWFF